MSSAFADKSGKGILLAGINRKTKPDPVTGKPVVFTLSDISFGAIEEVDVAGRSKKVVFSATEQSRFSGSQEVFYNRRDLTDIFANAGIDEVQIHQGPTTTLEVAEALNRRYSLGFTADDIVDEPVAEGATEVLISAVDGNYGYEGTVVVQLVEGKIPLAQIVVDTNLDDLGQNAEVPGYIIDVQFGEGEVTSKGQTPEGTLLVGSGNPSGNLTTASNGEIELAVGARIYRSSDLPVAQNGLYSFSIPDEGNNADWNFPFSVALLEEARAITELYDVTLTLKNDNVGGNAIDFQLRLDDQGVYHFVNDQLGLDISDSAKSESLDVVQNIQRATFYKEHLGALETNTNGAPLGNFSITLRAARREGLVEQVEVAIAVEILQEAVAS